MDKQGPPFWKGSQGMGKENKGRYWIDGLRNVMDWTDTYSQSAKCIFVSEFVFSVLLIVSWLFLIPGYVEGQPQTPVMKSSSKPETKVYAPTNIGVQNNGDSDDEDNGEEPDSPPPSMPRKVRPHRLRNMGLSSADAPEKYLRTVMFEIPADDLFKKYGWAQFMPCSFDSRENVYISFKNDVCVFDKTGKLIRSVKKESSEQYKFILGSTLLVDEKGNMCIIQPNSNIARIFDSDGNLINRVTFEKKFKKMRFSFGVIYSEETGDIVYKYPDADEKKISQKKFLKDFEEFKTNTSGIVSGFGYESDGEKYLFPDPVDGFHFEQIIDIDDFGNIYAKYYGKADDDPMGKNPIYHVYKFNSKCQLLAGFDFCPDYINLHTETVYHAEADPNEKLWSSPYGRIVKWEKSKNP
jgi:hypothetical protein